jgi:hypothetical protein
MLTDPTLASCVGEWWVAVCGEGRGRDESKCLERNDSGDVWWRT